MGRSLYSIIKVFITLSKGVLNWGDIFTPISISLSKPTPISISLSKPIENGAWRMVGGSHFAFLNPILSISTLPEKQLKAQLNENARCYKINASSNTAELKHSIYLITIK